MHQKLLATIRRLGLIPPSTRLVVAVSGGADSLALLHLLAALRQPLDLWLAIATLDHGLRGPAGGADAAFVADEAQRLGLLCIREQRDVAAYAERHGLSIEEAAREVRYRFLAECALALNVPLIATAHTADDQAETVLMHFLRGAGLDGLKGMLPTAPLPFLNREGKPLDGSALRVVRPLLWTTRAEIEPFLAEAGLTPREDESNSDLGFWRNRVRRELLPLLEGYQPNLRATLARAAETLGVEWGWLEAETEAAWGALAAPSAGDGIGFPRAAFNARPEALRRRLLRQAVATLRPANRDLSWEQATAAVALAAGGEVGQQATLPGGLTLYVEAERLWVGAEHSGAARVGLRWPALREQGSLPLVVPGTTPLPDGWSLTITALDGAPNPGDDPWQATLDAQEAGMALALRPRRPGDRFAPLGMAGQTVNLADWMTNQKIPAAARDTLPLLVAAGSDAILWVAGHRPAESARLRPTTRHCWQITLNPPD